MKMEVAKVDRRVRRTRKTIKKAFLSLLFEKDYNEITIADITNRAGYNRATYYVHFQDKDFLLREIVNEVLTGLADRMMSNYLDEQTNSSQRSSGIFTYIHEHASTFQALLHNDSLAYDFKTKMLQTIKSIYSEKIQLRTETGEIMSPDPEIYHTYAGAAVLGTIEYWIKNDMNHSPLHMWEQLTEITFQRPHRMLIR